MGILRRILVGTAWLLGSVVVLAAGLYMTALVVNRNDRPPSTEARELEAALDGLAEVADEENAYVFMLGFAAPRGADPSRIGAERADWIRRLRTDFDLSRESDPHSRGLLNVWEPARNDFFRQCPSRFRQRECFRMLNESGREVDAWLAEQEWILERYEALIGHARWRGIHTYDTRNPYPTISNVTAARSAWLLEAWARARRGDPAGVREALGADVEFWRLVLAEATSFQMKSVAASLIAAHFGAANIVLRQLPPETQTSAVPEAWREPISTAERSLRRPLALEFKAMPAFLDSFLNTSANGYAAWPGVAREEPVPAGERFGNVLLRPLLQRQDHINKTARQYAVIADASEASYAEVAVAAEAVRAPRFPEEDEAHWIEPLYNPVGDLLQRTYAYGVYADALARFADLEGARRAAVLTAELRGRGVEPGDVEAALASARLKHPYTGGPFRWDAETGAIVFLGLSSRYGGRHAFWY